MPDKYFLDHAQIFNSIQNVARLNFLEQELAIVMAHLKRVSTEPAGPYDEFKPPVLCNDLFNLLFLMERSFIKLTNRKMPYKDYSQDCLYVMNFKKLISQAFKRETKVQFYAKEMNISERTLQKALLQVLGKSTTELINEQRVLESKRLFGLRGYESERSKLRTGL